MRATNEETMEPNAKLTQAQMRALLVLLSASALPEPHSKYAYASKESVSEHPWAHKVHSRTAYGLEKMGLAEGHVVNVGRHWYTVYTITEAGVMRTSGIERADKWSPSAAITD